MADNSKNFEIKKGLTVSGSLIHTSGSRVGIGTTSPGSTLQVVGDNPQIRIGNSQEEDASVVFQGHQHTFYVGVDDTTDDLTFGTTDIVGNNVRMVIENAGNVGIGTATPDTPLHVVGDGKFTNTLYVGDSTSDELVVAGNISASGHISGGADIMIQRGNKLKLGEHNSGDETSIYASDSDVGQLNFLVSNNLGISLTPTVFGHWGNGLWAKGRVSINNGITGLHDDDTIGLMVSASIHTSESLSVAKNITVGNTITSTSNIIGNGHISSSGTLYGKVAEIEDDLTAGGSGSFNYVSASGNIQAQTGSFDVLSIPQVELETLNISASNGISSSGEIFAPSLTVGGFDQYNNNIGGGGITASAGITASRDSKSSLNDLSLTGTLTLPEGDITSSYQLNSDNNWTSQFIWGGQYRLRTTSTTWDDTTDERGTFYAGFNDLCSVRWIDAYGIRENSPNQFDPDERYNSLNVDGALRFQTRKLTNWRTDDKTSVIFEITPGNWSNQEYDQYNFGSSSDAAGNGSEWYHIQNFNNTADRMATYQFVSRKKKALHMDDKLTSTGNAFAIGNKYIGSSTFHTASLFVTGSNIHSGQVNNDARVMIGTPTSTAFLKINTNASSDDTNVTFHEDGLIGGKGGTLAIQGFDKDIIFYSGSTTQEAQHQTMRIHKWNTDIDSSAVSVGSVTNPSASFNVEKSVWVGGNITSDGVITAAQYQNLFQSSSVIYASGSSNFGDSFDDEHTFTGSLGITGSNYNHIMGNVGINVKSPQELLHLKRDDSYKMFFENTAGENFSLNHHKDNGLQFLREDGSPQPILGLSNDHKVRIYDTNGTEWVRFDESDSTNTLYVDGNISSSGELHFPNMSVFRFTGSGGDYNYNEFASYPAGDRTDFYFSSNRDLHFSGESKVTFKRWKTQGDGTVSNGPEMSFKDEAFYLQNYSLSSSNAITASNILLGQAQAQIAFNGSDQGTKIDFTQDNIAFHTFDPTSTVYPTMLVAGEVVNIGVPAGGSMGNPLVDFKVFSKHVSKPMFEVNVKDNINGFEGVRLGINDVSESLVVTGSTVITHDLDVGGSLTFSGTGTFPGITANGGITASGDLGTTGGDLFTSDKLYIDGDSSTSASQNASWIGRANGNSHWDDGIEMISQLNSPDDNDGNINIIADGNIIKLKNNWDTYGITGGKFELTRRDAFLQSAGGVDIQYGNLLGANPTSSFAITHGQGGEEVIRVNYGTSAKGTTLIKPKDPYVVVPAGTLANSPATLTVIGSGSAPHNFKTYGAAISASGDINVSEGHIRLFHHSNTSATYQEPSIAIGCGGYSKNGRIGFVDGGGGTHGTGQELWQATDVNYGIKFKQNFTNVADKSGNLHFGQLDQDSSTFNFRRHELHDDQWIFGDTGKWTIYSPTARAPRYVNIYNDRRNGQTFPKDASLGLGGGIYSLGGLVMGDQSSSIFSKLSETTGTPNGTQLGPDFDHQHNIIFDTIRSGSGDWDSWDQVEAGTLSTQSLHGAGVGGGGGSRKIIWPSLSSTVGNGDKKVLTSNYLSHNTWRNTGLYSVGSTYDSMSISNKAGPIVLSSEYTSGGYKTQISHSAAGVLRYNGGLGAWNEPKATWHIDYHDTNVGVPNHSWASKDYGKYGLYISNEGSTTERFAQIDMSVANAFGRIALSHHDTNEGNFNFLVDGSGDNTDPQVAFTIASDGNIGIGEDARNPEAKLHITSSKTNDTVDVLIEGGNGNVPTSLTFRDGPTSNDVRLEHDLVDHCFTMGGQGFGYIHLSQRSTNGSGLDPYSGADSCRIGIGNTSHHQNGTDYTATKTLEVLGDISASGDLFLGNRPDANDGLGTKILFMSGSTNSDCPRIHGLDNQMIINGDDIITLTSTDYIQAITPGITIAGNATTPQTSPTRIGIGKVYSNGHNTANNYSYLDIDAQVTMSTSSSLWLQAIGHPSQSASKPFVSSSGVVFMGPWHNITSLQDTIPLQIKSVHAGGSEGNRCSYGIMFEQSDANESDVANSNRGWTAGVGNTGNFQFGRTGNDDASSLDPDNRPTIEFKYDTGGMVIRGANVGTGNIDHYNSRGLFDVNGDTYIGGDLHTDSGIQFSNDISGSHSSSLSIGSHALIEGDVTASGVVSMSSALGYYANKWTNGASYIGLTTSGMIKTVGGTMLSGEYHGGNYNKITWTNTGVKSSFGKFPSNTADVPHTVTVEGEISASENIYSDLNIIATGSIEAKSGFKGTINTPTQETITSIGIQPHITGSQLMVSNISASGRLKVFQDTILGADTHAYGNGCFAPLQVRHKNAETDSKSNNFNDYSIVIHNDDNTPEAFAGIAFKSSTSDPDAELEQIGAAIKGLRSSDNSAGQDKLDLAFYTNGTGGDQGNSKRMTITYDGNVGVGLSDPDEKFVVDGNIKATGNVYAQEFHTEFVSASIIHESGSTALGDTVDDLHWFAGQLTGSTLDGAIRFASDISMSNGSQISFQSNDADIGSIKTFNGVMTHQSYGGFIFDNQSTVPYYFGNAGGSDNEGISWKFGTNSVGTHSRLVIQGSISSSQGFVSEWGGNTVSMSQGDISASGNITSNKLSIIGSPGSSGQIYVNDGDDGTGVQYGLYINKSGDNGFMYNRDNGNFSLGTNDIQQFSIENNASVAGTLKIKHEGIDVFGNITASGNISSSGALHANQIKADLTTGTDNSVVIQDTDGFLKTDEIDSRVWGSTLVDATNGSSNRLAIFSDNNTVNGDADVTYAAGIDRFLVPNISASNGAGGGYLRSNNIYIADNTNPASNGGDFISGSGGRLWIRNSDNTTSALTNTYDDFGLVIQNATITEGAFAGIAFSVSSSDNIQGINNDSITAAIKAIRPVDNLNITNYGDLGFFVSQNAIGDEDKLIEAGRFDYTKKLQLFGDLQIVDGYPATLTETRLHYDQSAGKLTLNKDTATANDILFEIMEDDQSKFTVDEDGDVWSAKDINANGQMSASGDMKCDELHAAGDVIAFYSSDERLKYNVQTIENPLDKISKLRGVRYNWGSNQTTYPEGTNDSGIIAQDVQKVLPELVKERGDGYLAVKHDRLVGLLIESIKEQQTQIDELKDEVKKLKEDK